MQAHITGDDKDGKKKRRDIHTNQSENKGLYPGKIEELWKNANSEKVFDSQDGGAMEWTCAENKRNESSPGQEIHKERVISA